MSSGYGTCLLDDALCQGTSGYAPLEQYTQRGELHACSDVYALAATLYYLLTGETPSPAVARANGQELHPPDRINPQISGTLSGIILRAMGLQASTRPQSVRSFLASLRTASVPGAAINHIASAQIAALTSPAPQASGVSTLRARSATVSSPNKASSQPVSPLNALQSQQHASTQLSSYMPGIEISNFWPEVRQGIIRGAIVGGVSGPFLGGLAATMLGGSIVHGVLRGFSVTLIGAIAGGVIGLLRAQPVPTAVPGAGSQTGSSPAPASVLMSALEGAGKGACIRAVLGAGLVLQHFLGGPLGAPADPWQALLLFGIAGMIGGGLVGVIQSMPRDRK